MRNKQDNAPLTEDQRKEIDMILKRIRTGLELPITSQFEEPAHLFIPEASNANEV